ncbi:hypothetical protein E2C01_020672 [Portunus trituberculatus]|uniref:Uncharacterized protein n=1 Tax=Portunus trituberculatus TaxID=210409 RepID=A0A5B7E0G3_PORTR|nr:hypothetical protein [Portunus trituberculatus]
MIPFRCLLVAAASFASKERCKTGWGGRASRETGITTLTQMPFWDRQPVPQAAGSGQRSLGRVYAAVWRLTREKWYRRGHSRPRRRMMYWSGRRETIETREFFFILGIQSYTTTLACPDETRGEVVQWRT